MILTENEKQTIIQKISERIVGKIKILIYGSRVRNIQTKDSDIDILVLTENLVSNEEIRKMKIEISEALGGTKIDIVTTTFDNKSPFVELIEDDAVVIWEKK